VADPVSEGAAAQSAPENGFRVDGTRRRHGCGRPHAHPWGWGGKNGGSEGGGRGRVDETSGEDEWFRRGRGRIKREGEG